MSKVSVCLSGCIFLLGLCEVRFPFYTLSSLFIIADIRQHVKHVEKAVSTKEPRFMSRALRAIVTLRKKFNDSVLRKAILLFIPASPTAAVQKNLLEYLEEVCIIILHVHIYMHSVRDLLNFSSIFAKP